MKRAYTCDRCGEKCLSDWDDEEAIAEYERDFGVPFDPDELLEICDDCYRDWQAYQRNQSAGGKTEVEE